MDDTTRYRNALMWVFDRLSVIDVGGMTVKEQRATQREVGRVLLGNPSRAATHEPNEWDDSARLARPHAAREES